MVEERAASRFQEHVVRDPVELQVQRVEPRLAFAVAPDPRLSYEDKGYSVALHYRQAPLQEERLRAHLALSASEARFRAMIEDASVGILAAEAGGLSKDIFSSIFDKLHSIA